MDAQIFRRHLKEFYPLITKLICCDQVCTSSVVVWFHGTSMKHVITLELQFVVMLQMDVRGALGDLFSKQLTPLMP